MGTKAEECKTIEKDEEGMSKSIGREQRMKESEREVKEKAISSSLLTKVILLERLPENCLTDSSLDLTFDRR